MKELMENLKTLTDKTIKTYEIEYIKDCPYFIGIRLYGEDKKAAEQVEKIINERLPDQVISTNVYTPHPDTVKYGFCGYNFTGIEVEVDLKTVTPLNDDYMVMDDNERDI